MSPYLSGPTTYHTDPRPDSTINQQIVRYDNSFPAADHPPRENSSTARVEPKPRSWVPVALAGCSWATWTMWAKRFIRTRAFGCDSLRLFHDGTGEWLRITWEAAARPSTLKASPRNQFHF